MKSLDQIEFCLSVVTAYHGTSGKVSGTMKHGIELKTKAFSNYDHALNTADNHYQAAIACLNKVMNDHNKQFEIIAYSYNEKDTGYTFICKRIN